VSGARVAFVFRQVQPDVSTRHRDEPGKASSELMLPLLDEPEPLAPRDSTPGVLDIQNRHHFFGHFVGLDHLDQVTARSPEPVFRNDP
jgi:hypothetical protein